MFAIPSTPEGLTDDEALDAMLLACNAMIETALEQRLELLHLGFPARHTACRELDAVAKHWASRHRQLIFGSRERA